MVTIREYAKNNGVSYEAVRKQVNRYKGELQSHITKVNRTQYLDDEAVAFLDSKRAENPIIIMESNKDDEIKRLEMENKALLIKIAELQEALLNKQEALLAEKDQVKLLQNEKIELLEARKPERKRWFFGR